MDDQPTISTHVLDTEHGWPAKGVTVKLFRSRRGGDRPVGEGDDRRRRPQSDGCSTGELEGGDYRIEFALERPVLRQRLVHLPRRRHDAQLPRAAAHGAVLADHLPRQLMRAVARAAGDALRGCAALRRAARGRAGQSGVDELLERAEQIALEMPEDEQVELLDAHPRIGAAPASVSALSYREQGYDRDPGTAALQARLDRLNAATRRRFGFRFVVFVNGRSAERDRGRSWSSTWTEPTRDGEAARAARRDRHRAQSGAPVEGRRGAIVRAEIYYGKADVATYRTYATPLTGSRRFPSRASPAVRTRCWRRPSRSRCWARPS